MFPPFRPCAKSGTNRTFQRLVPMVLLKCKYTRNIKDHHLFFVIYVIFAFFHFRLGTKLWVHKTPEQLIWGYPDSLLEAGKLVDDSIPMTEFGFFTKVSIFQTSAFFVKMIHFFNFRATCPISLNCLFTQCTLVKMIRTNYQVFHFSTVKIR